MASLYATFLIPLLIASLFPQAFPIQTPQSENLLVLEVHLGYVQTLQVVGQPWISALGLGASSAPVIRN